MNIDFILLVLGFSCQTYDERGQGNKLLNAIPGIDQPEFKIY